MECVCKNHPQYGIEINADCSIHGKPRRFDAIRWHGNGPGWSWDNSVMEECSDGDFVRVEDLKSVLFQVRQAQARLQDEYPNRTESGKANDVAAACENLRNAHVILTLLCGT